MVICFNPLGPFSWSLFFSNTWADSFYDFNIWGVFILQALFDISVIRISWEGLIFCLFCRLTFAQDALFSHLMQNLRLWAHVWWSLTSFIIWCALEWRSISHEMFCVCFCQAPSSISVSHYNIHISLYLNPEPLSRERLLGMHLKRGLFSLFILIVFLNDWGRLFFSDPMFHSKSILWSHG